MFQIVETIMGAALDEALITPIFRGYQHPQWSERRWTYEANAGVPITHRNGKSVPSHRLIPFDRSRYTGEALRAIRASATNFKGEVRR